MRAVVCFVLKEVKEVTEVSGERCKVCVVVNFVKHPHVAKLGEGGVIVAKLGEKEVKGERGERCES